MKAFLLLLVVFSATLWAQDTVPVGTVLPVQLNSSLPFNKARVGQKISARLMQDVPLPGLHAKIHEGSEVVGQVVAVRSAGTSAAAEMDLQFDAIVDHGHRLPILTNLRALASMMDVNDAQLPDTGPDRGTSEANWTTHQIGGDIVYRPGQVDRGDNVVGKSMFGSAVLARVSANPEGRCRGAISGNVSPQAFWVFSSNACGIYGYPELTISHAGRTDPVGEIKLESRKKDLNIRSGSGLLLRVMGNSNLHKIE
jgi:hypothetical protein